MRLTPSLELADDRWSEVNPPPAFPYVKTGAYALLDFDATYSLPRYVDLSLEFKNLLDDYSELAWGYPQAGRTFYLKTRMQSSNSHADYRWRQKGRREIRGLD